MSRFSTLLLGSIPSPSSGNLGPFRMYGVILAVGVLVAVWLSERRWRARSYPRDGIYDIAFWVVIWGVTGARLYTSSATISCSETIRCVPSRSGAAASRSGAR